MNAYKKSRVPYDTHGCVGRRRIYRPCRPIRSKRFDELIEIAVFLQQLKTVIFVYIKYFYPLCLTLKQYASAWYDTV